jgi:RNA polymerase sigma-70 factor (ECF subfamily)
MIDLSDDDRTILELARDAHDPDARDRARVRAQLASRIGAAAGLGLAAGLGAATKTTATVSAAATSAGATAGMVGASAAVVKLVGAALIVSATVGVGATVVHRARHAPVARVAVAQRLPAPAPVERSTPAVHRAPEVAEVAPSVAPAVTHSFPPRREKQTPRARAIVAPPNVERGSALKVGDETRLVQAGVLARRSGQPARALELLDQHARLYPTGVLAEERDAERALALADLGRAREARAAIDQFLYDYPTSAAAAALRARERLLPLKGP